MWCLCLHIADIYYYIKEKIYTEEKLLVTKDFLSILILKIFQITGRKVWTPLMASSELGSDR